MLNKTPSSPDSEVQEPDLAPSAPDRLELASRTLPRRRFFDDMSDKGFFAVAALAGFLAIIILKTNTKISSEIIAGLAVAVMLIYGVSAFRLPAMQMRPDRLG